MLAKRLVGIALPMLAAAAAAASSSVTSMYVVGVLKQFDIVGYTLAADATATTYSIHCPIVTDGEVDDDDCGLGPGMTVIAASSTTKYHLAQPEGTFKMDATCSFGSTTEAACTTILSGGNEGSIPVTTTTTLHSVPLFTVTMTGAPVTATGGASGTTTGGSTTVSETPAGSSAATTTPTGGMPQVTGNMDLLLAGAAVAFAAAL